MITITGTLSKAWMHRALGVAFDRDYYFDPAERHAIDCRCNEYAAEDIPGHGALLLGIESGADSTTGTRTRSRSGASSRT